MKLLLEWHLVCEDYISPEVQQLVQQCQELNCRLLALSHGAKFDDTFAQDPYGFAAKVDDRCCAYANNLTF